MANTSVATLKIEGMTCGGCVRSVTNALQAAPGVSQAQVDLAAAQATVAFDPTVTSPEALVALIDDIGFDAGIQAPSQ